MSGRRGTAGFSSCCNMCVQRCGSLSGRNTQWNFYVLLAVRLSINLDINQFDAHLLYFTIFPLQSSTCF